MAPKRIAYSVPETIIYVNVCLPSHELLCRLKLQDPNRLFPHLFDEFFYTSHPQNVILILM